jgi:acyl-CoA dehydrogenase
MSFMSSMDRVQTQRGNEIAQRVEDFVRTVVIPYERDPRCGHHGPSEDLVHELRGKAREAGVLTPHILPDGGHLTQLETAAVLKRSGLSPLGPIAVNTAAPDEGNMYLLGKIGTAAQKERFLVPLVSGAARSAFFMTEPAMEGGAGSDPSMLQTTARRDGGDWLIDGRKAFITGAEGASVGILMARSNSGEKVAATLFLVDLPHPAIRIERILDTIFRIACGGMARLPAPMRSRPLMPVAVARSASC